ncbi:hypothetical protein L1887_14047 [Cichorium endivia]|nr:hypothetical protein L1887_14047 [Cichorium endivia]
MDLVDRNLLIVAERKFNGDVRVCKVHDLVRELCIEKAEEERFFLRVIDSALSSGFGNTISLSYAGLTLPLRRCFLYLGRIRKNSWIHVHVLIRSWIRQGFIQEDESGSLEEIAEGYLMHLVYKNLIIIDERKYDGDVLRVCKVHDLAWKICFGKTKSTFKNFQKFLKRTADVITTDKQRRVFTNKNIYIVSSAYLPIPSIRSLTCFHDETSLFYDTPEYFRSFALLRVLNLPNCKFIDFPPEIGLLVHLRYLAIEKSLCLSPICNLWSLQTLIIRRSYSFMVLPGNISNLVNLRHLWSNEVLYLPSIRKPMNLQTISNVVMLGDGVGNFQKCFPIVKKLACAFYSDAENDFESLRYLETLKLTGSDSLTRESTDPQFLRGEPNYQKNNIRFPTTLKKLTLVRCHLPWSDMSIIQSLPNLEALRLIDNAFDGTLWETGDEQFQQLKFLTLKELHIRRWEASCINFPCLKRFRVVKCNDLEEIPLEIGDISTLEFLEADGCGASLNTSLGNIRQEQDDTGNYELKIKVDGRQLLSCVPKHED